MPAEVALISEGTATRFTNVSFIIVMFVNVICKFLYPFFYFLSDMAL